MYKRVDESSNNLEGFSYLDQDGEEERVKFDGAGSYRLVCIVNSVGEETTIYKADIPKMILALQTAYEHKQEK